MNPELRKLADEYWEYTLSHAPTRAHLRGDYRFMDRMEDASRAAEDANVAAQRVFAARARSFDPSTLDSSDQVTQESLIHVAETTAGVEEMRQAEFGVDPVFGPQASLLVSVPQMSVETDEHAEKMLDKYSAIAGMIDQLSERLREGLASGRVNAQFAVEKTTAQLDAILATPVEDDVFLSAQMPDTYSEADIEAWKTKAAAVITGEVRPAFQRYRDLIRDEIGPVARPDDEAGLRYLPDGDLVYSRLIEKYTTLPMQAEEIHEIGLQQIDRLASEYLELAGPLLDTTSLEDIMIALRDDPSLHHTSGTDIVRQSEEAFAAAKAEMGNWFGRLPKTDCFVEETQHGPIAFYLRPAEDGSREGTFFMNTSDPSSWSTYEVQATSFHEGIPGHHLQLAIAQELGDAIPAFQRNGTIAAYGEGWGLYTERLADEMGLYSSEWDRVGMLSADSMRACRLVVDTGMHALGWSRQRAIDYVAANSPLSMHTIVEEIERYLSFPGQALSYMIGRLEMQRMRADAEAALGTSFDIKSFHDVVLGSGLVTMQSLERIIREWTVEQSSR